MDRFTRWQYRLMESADPDEPDQGGAPPPKPDENMIPRDILPEELRDRSPAEVKFLLDRMATGLAESNDTTRDLRSRISEMEARLSAPPPQEPDPDDDIPDEELIVKDPTKAVMRILQRTGMTERFSSVENTLGDTVLKTFGGDLPDFDEYAEDVDKILRQSRSPRDKAHIEGAYAMAVGQRVIADRAKAARKSASVDTPRDDTPKDSFPELSGLEKQIFESTGLSRERYEALKADDDIDMKVPT